MVKRLERMIVKQGKWGAGCSIIDNQLMKYGQILRAHYSTVTLARLCRVRKVGQKILRTLLHPAYIWCH
ncbi:uncharacterized protein C8R40DRAFT_1093751, partial [Lentinula edodes]|uniref:uncharacterized protein n=1 Tax=Lentinula edodes TaxID=5353 RepID=UPI001E8EBDC7